MATNSNCNYERAILCRKFISVLLLVGIFLLLGKLSVDAHSLASSDEVNHQQMNQINTAHFDVYLPMIAKRWPPTPDQPILDPIGNADQDNFYTISWHSSSLADTYILEEATNAMFSDATVIYDGQYLSWNIPAPGKIPGTYYYRVKARNSWGVSSWSDPQAITIYPLFVGLQVRWDGMGYIRGSEYYDVGSHLQRELNEITSPDTIKSHNYNWYDPDPQGWGSSTWDSYYSVSTGYFKSSSIPGDPSWKWGMPWVLPYDWQLENGVVISIGGQPFLTSGPYSGYTAFGKPVEYWVLVNRDKFLYWDGGGDWTQYVHAGDITLWYDADNSRLLLHRDVLRRYYYQGELTSDTVQYISNLTYANSFPDVGIFLNETIYRIGISENRLSSEQDIVE